MRAVHGAFSVVAGLLGLCVGIGQVIAAEGADCNGYMRTLGPGFVVFECGGKCPANFPDCGPPSPTPGGDQECLCWDAMHTNAIYYAGSSKCKTDCQSWQGGMQLKCTRIDCPDPEHCVPQTDPADPAKARCYCW